MGLGLGNSWMDLYTWIFFLHIRQQTEIRSFNFTKISDILIDIFGIKLKGSLQIFILGMWALGEVLNPF